MAAPQRKISDPGPFRNASDGPGDPQGKHVLLTGPVGIGKSAILDAVIRNIARRRSDQYQLDPLIEEAPLPDFEHGERRRTQGLILVYVAEHQAKGQFLTIAKRLLETGLIKPSALDFAKSLDQKPPQETEWVKVRHSVNRLSIRDLSGAIIPAIHHHHKKNEGGQILIAVDDMTRLTPTQQAFPALSAEASAEIVRNYICAHGNADRIARAIHLACRQVGRGQPPSHLRHGGRHRQGAGGQQAPDPRDAPPGGDQAPRFRAGHDRRRGVYHRLALPRDRPWRHRPLHHGRDGGGAVSELKVFPVSGGGEGELRFSAIGCSR